MTLTPEVNRMAWTLAVRSLMWKKKEKGTRAEAYSKNRIRHLLHVAISNTKMPPEGYAPQPANGGDPTSNRGMLNTMIQKDKDFWNAIREYIPSLVPYDQKDFFRALLWNIQILETISNVNAGTAGSPTERFAKMLECEGLSDLKILIREYEAFCTAKPQNYNPNMKNRRRY